MNAIRKKNLMRAAISAFTFIVLFATVDFFSGELDPIWLYLVKSMFFFLIYFALECILFHPVKETQEEHEAKDKALYESLKKQIEPFVRKADDNDRILNN